MKKSRSNHRSFAFLGLITMLCLGLFLSSFPPKTASAAGNTDTSGNSGGFIVQADKVEGSMNVVAMAAGNVDMGEGKIYGLTITKVLQKSKPNLIIKIKSQGPIPVKDLKGKLMGLPQFSSPCVPSKLGWLCLSNVKMKLSEQTVGAISLPNATIETCFEGQCEAPDQNINGSTVTADQGNSQKDPTDLTQVTDQLDQLNKTIEQATDLQQVVDKGTDTLDQIVKDAEGAVNVPDKLGPITDQIDKTYDHLKDQLDKLDPLLDTSNQLLTPILNLINQDNADQLITSLGGNLQKLKDTVKTLQDQLKKLTEKQLASLANLNNVKTTLNNLKDTIVKNKDHFSNGQLSSVLQNLGSTVDKVNSAIPPILPSHSSSKTSPPTTTSTKPSTTTTTTSTKTSPTTTPTTGGTNTGSGSGQTGGGTSSDTGTGTDTGNGGTDNQIDPKIALENQLNDLIQQGKNLAKTIQPSIDKANLKMDDMDHLSGLLVGTTLLILHILNGGNADQYQADLNDLQNDVSGMEGPVKQLKAVVSQAEDIQNQLGENRTDLKALKGVLDQVQGIKTRLNDVLKKELIGLPLLSSIQLFIDQIDDIVKEMDTW